MTEQQQALDAGLSQLKTAITDATLRITNKLDAAKAAALVAGVDLTTEIGDVQSDINILHSIGSEPSAPPAVVPSDSVIVTPTAPVETPEAAPMPTDVSGFSSTLDA